MGFVLLTFQFALLMVDRVAELAAHGENGGASA
jgi:hypothetical protein